MVRWNKAYIKGTEEIVGIDDDRFAKVEYVCMACGTDMIARRGKTRVHHFAHKENNVKCNPESYFHKLGKRIFKEIYDTSSSFVIKPSSKALDLKNEYGECLIEIKEKGIMLKRNADLYIKHLKDETKDISVEILYSHQITKKKLDGHYRIIEIRLPIDISVQDDTDSDKIEQKIKDVCTPPLSECDNIRFYNFEDDIIYQEVPLSSGINYSNNTDEQECLGTDEGRRSVPKFKNYMQYNKNVITKGHASSNEKSTRNPEFVPVKDTNSKKREASISGYLLQPRMEAIKPTVYFDVDIFIKAKYPNIRHQPAVLPSYKNIIDVIVEDGGKEYWLGIDYRKNEVFTGDLERKIPNKWKEAVREYIKNLKPIDENIKQR